MHKARPGDYKPEPRHEVDFRKLSPVRCQNVRCITHHEGYLTAQFYFVGHAASTIACAYCEHERPAPTGLEART